MRLRLIMGAAALGLVAAACGADDPVTVTEPAGSETAEAAQPAPTTGANSGETAADDTAGESAAPEAALAGTGDVPDLQMIDMHTGTPLGLQSVVDGQTPLLFWFWAPH